LFRKGKEIFLTLFFLLLFELLIIFLINPSWNNFLIAGHLTVTGTIVLVFFFLSLNFSLVASIREEAMGYGRALSKGIVSSLKILIPVVLLAGIVSEFFLLSDQFKVPIIFIGFVFYFWIIFANYVALRERRKNMEAFIRALHLLKRNYLTAFWRIIAFSVVLFLATIALVFPFALIHFFVGLPFWAIIALGFVFLFFLACLINVYLSLLCENVWKIRQHIAFSAPPPLYNLAVTIFLLVVFLILILATIAIG
jgi:hypothetical protein